MNEKPRRGFASMDERQRQIASKGGKAAHVKGRAHEFTPQSKPEKLGVKGGRGGGCRPPPHGTHRSQRRRSGQRRPRAHGKIGRKGGAAVSEDCQQHGRSVAKAVTR